MTDNRSMFSQRHGYQAPDNPICVREDAPPSLREGLIMLAYDLGLGPHSVRAEICGILLRAPDPGNWSAYPNVDLEVHSLMTEAPWYRVYDIAEKFYSRLRQEQVDRSVDFERRLNELFRERGIGWQMQNGRIIVRGSESFGASIKAATDAMAQLGKQTASREMHEALADLSRRPDADVTGAIQHAMASLECVAREVSGLQSKTLGQLIPELKLPKPLDIALEKLWGFASEQGRHLREDRSPQFEDAQLVVTIASAVGAYLLRRGPLGRKTAG